MVHMASSRFVSHLSYEVSGFKLGNSSPYRMVSSVSFFFLVILAYFLIILILKRPPKILKGNFKMFFEIFSPSFQTIPTQFLIYCIQTNHGQENPLRTNEVKCFLFLLIVKTFPIHCIFNIESKARTITFLILRSNHVSYSKVSFC